MLAIIVGVGPSQHSVQATPDGLHLVAALPALGYHPVLDPLDLAQLGASPSQLNPNSVAIRSDGLLGAGVDDDVPGPYGGSGSFEWTVAVSTTALGEPVRNVRLPLAAKIETQGATFGRRDLYTVAQAAGDLVLRRHKMPAVRPITLTGDTAVYERGDQIRLVAHLEGREGASRAAPRGTPGPPTARPR